MLFWVKGLVACLLSTARAKDADAQNSFNDKYLKSYLPPGDEHYTDSWVGSNSSWRHYMSDFSGKSGDYQKYLSEYGGPQANYDQYVSLYASMAGSNPTSGDNYMGKGKSQLNAWNKSMMTTYNLYIPGAYENFAEQATEERTEKKGQGVGQGTMNEGHAGGGKSEGGGSGGTPWMPKGGKESHSEGGSGGGGGGGEVGYEPFARPWVVQYATSEGGHNAFDYEGKEFASGGMEMGGVQDYADYMNQYAGEWVPADSVEETHESQQKDGKAPSSKHEKTGSSAKDESKKEETEDSKDDSKDSKPQHHKSSNNDDSHFRTHGESGSAEAKDDVDPHDKSSETKRSKALRHTDKKDQKEKKHHKDADDKSSKVASLESAGRPQVQPHPAQPVLPRWSVSKEMASMSDDVPHPAQPVLPQQSTAAKEAVAEVRHAIKQLQQAAQDTTYAAWTMAKHSPAPELTEEQKQLAEAMSRLWKVTREPLNDKSMKELEDAGRSASMAITRLRDAELHQLRISASSTRRKLLKGAKDWSEQLQRDAQKQENDQLAKEAKEAGAELEKSLSDALSDRTQKKAQELLLHAKQRKQLLQGVLGEAVDVAQMVQKDPDPVTVAPPTVPEAANQVEVEAVELPRPSFAADKLKAVSGGYLLVAITIAGLFYSVAGFLVRRSAAPTRPPSREIALLAMGEP